MKEAAGEANMTVITIVLIAVVLAAGKIIITSALNSTGRQTCEAQGGTYTPQGAFEMGNWGGSCSTDNT